MAQFTNQTPDHGRIRTSERPGDGVIVVTFDPTDDSLRQAGRKRKDTPPVVLAEIDSASRIMRMYPVVTLPIPDRFLRPKYDKIRCIRVPFEEPYFDVDASLGVDGFIELLTDLPRGLIRDPQYGLGIAKEYQTILDELEERTECTELVLSNTETTQVDRERFVLTLRDFESQRAELDRIANRAQTAAIRVKRASTHNWLAPTLGIPKVPVNRGRHPMVQLLTDSAADSYTLTDEDQDTLVAATLESTAAIAKRRPDALAKLAGDIELVTLEVLIERFHDAIGKRKSEPFWQDFFSQNPFALHLAFGAPVVLVQAQASVGGRRLSGEGEKLADFLVKNVLTGNLAIFEIKRPDTKLVEGRPYRLGLHGPSKELSAAINQVLDQRHQLEQTLPLLKSTSREWSIESYAVRCCVIAGQVPADEDQNKSFELFRGNSRNVEVVTYDELLEKLEQLHHLLSSAQDSDA